MQTSAEVKAGLARLVPKMRRNVESARRFNVFRAHNRQRKKGARCYNLAMKTGWIFLLDLLLDGVMVTLALRLGGLKASVWKIGLAALAGAAAVGCARGCRRECAPRCGCRLPRA